MDINGDTVFLQNAFVNIPKMNHEYYFIDKKLPRNITLIVDEQQEGCELTFVSKRSKQKSFLAQFLRLIHRDTSCRLVRTDHRR